MLGLLYLMLPGQLWYFILVYHTKFALVVCMCFHDTYSHCTIMVTVMTFHFLICIVLSLLFCPYALLFFPYHLIDRLDFYICVYLPYNPMLSNKHCVNIVSTFLEWE